MYIAKPHKGFVIPVEYMVNENLFDDSNKYLRSKSDYKTIEADNVENNSIFGETDNRRIRKEQVVEAVVNDRLFSDDEEEYIKDSNDIMYVLEERNNKVDSGSGMLVFDDVDENDVVVIDEKKSMELDRARGNLRKAIEVEIEKVGKLVLDDTEAEIASKVAVKSADTQINKKETENLEGNIEADDISENKN